MAEDGETIRVVTEAVEKEGKKWKRLSDEISPIKGRIERLDLSELSFFISPLYGADASVHHASYDDFQAFMAKAVGGAPTEFEQLGTALDKIAAHYDRTDSTSSRTIADVAFGEPGGAS